MPAKKPRLYRLSNPEKKLFNAIRKCLSRDLLTPKWRSKVPPGSPKVFGHCFIATNAAYHLFGKKHGLDPHVSSVGDDATHWWLWNRKTGEYLDPTHEQAAKGFPYDKGKRNLVFVKRKGKDMIDARTKELIRRVRIYMKS